MRIGLMIAIAATSAAVALSISGGPASAQPYPYCAIAGGYNSYENCHYPSFGACMAAVSGVGGFCQQNPRFAGYYDTRGEQPLRRKSRRVRR